MKLVNLTCPNCGANLQINAQNSFLLLPVLRNKNND